MTVLPLPLDAAGLTGRREAQKAHRHLLGLSPRQVRWEKTEKEIQILMEIERHTWRHKVGKGKEGKKKRGWK